jgi:uncharacterized protein
MQALPASPVRHQSLDAIRGFAVMGILLMNIIGFAMPGEAYANPRAWGGTSTADLWTWAIMFVLVDGKFRGLFSLLFGASMLLVVNRAEARGENKALVNRTRMGWLLVFGLLHSYLIWSGDILIMYAVCGFVAILFVDEDVAALRRIAISLILANLLIWGGLTLANLGDMPSAPDAKSITRELATFGGRYADILRYRFAPERIADPAMVFFSNALETIGFFALGMMMLRNGFLTGDWARLDYARFAVKSYAVGIPPLLGCAVYLWLHQFDVNALRTVGFAVAPLFRVAVMLGHAAVLLLLIKHFETTRAMARIVAVGRAAFTNYLGTSILMTTLFYGYGFGLYGKLSRLDAYMIVPCVWVIMLLWSKPWLDRFAYGPLEWLWRSLSRGKRQPMRRVG